MFRLRSLPLLVLLTAALLGLTQVAATAARKDSGRRPVRVHYSGNIEGELEPCG